MKQSPYDNEKKVTSVTKRSTYFQSLEKLRIKLSQLFKEPRSVVDSEDATRKCLICHPMTHFMKNKENG